jgi:hypothetical protein
VRCSRTLWGASRACVAVLIDELFDYGAQIERSIQDTSLLEELDSVE